MHEDPHQSDPLPPADPRVGGPTDTSWVSPDPPPIPERIRKKVEARRASLPALPRVAVDRRWLRIVGLLAAGVVVLTVAGFYFQRGEFDAKAEARWQQLCGDYGRWFGPLQRTLDHGDHVVLQDMGLAAVVDAIKSTPTFDPRLIADRPDANVAALAQQPPQSARTAAAIEATRVAAVGVTRIESAFAQWPTAMALRQHLHLLNNHGWVHAAYVVNHTLDRAPPYGGAPVSESLYAMRRLEAQTTGIVAAVEELERDLAVLRPIDDPVIQRLIADVRRLDHRKPNPTLADDDAAGQLVALSEALQPLQAFAQRFRAAVENERWQTIDHDNFRANGRAYAMLVENPSENGGGSGDATDDQAIFRAWLDEAGGFEQAGEDWRGDWAEALDRDQLQPLTDALHTLQRASHPSAKPLANRLDQLRQRVGDLLAQPFVAGATAEFEIQKTSLQREISELSVNAGKLARDVTATRTAAALRDADQPLTDAPFASAAVDTWWTSQRRKLADRLEKDDDLDAAARDIQRTRAQLLTLIDPASDTALALPPRFETAGHLPVVAALLDALTLGVESQREATLKQALRDGLPVSAERWSALRRSFAERLAEARQIAATAERADHALAGAYPLDDALVSVEPGGLAGEVAAWRDSVWGKDTAVGRAATGVIDQVALVASRSEAATWNEVIQSVLKAEQPAVAFAAWRRMQQVDWPTDPRSLELERTAEAHLHTFIPSIERRNAKRAAALTQELADARPIRWRLALSAANTDEQRRVVLGQAQAMGVDPDSLPEAQRFNLMLSRVQSAVKSLPTEPGPRRDAELLALTQAFAAQVRPLSGDPGIAALLDTLDQLTARGADDREMLAEAGPARLGWTPHPHPDGAAVTFTREHWSLTFVRIDPTPPGNQGKVGFSQVNGEAAGDGRPFYICTTELPVGLALDAVAWRDAAAEWAAVMPPRLDDGDTRKGPRVWTYRDSAAAQNAATLELNPNDWLGPSPIYPHGHTPTPPTPQHPINYVSAQGAAYLAATLGCRLPTIDQWRAAQRRYPVPPGRLPNLRDTTWARHAAQATELIAAGVPGIDAAHSDAFGPDAGDGAADRPADLQTAGHYHPVNDNTLWFTPVPSPIAPPAPNDDRPAEVPEVVDLIGNVAELVTAGPIDPDSLLNADQPIADRRDAFVQKYTQDFAVLGGSALSPVSLNPETPQPFNLKSGGRGYADVGLRLVFTPTAVSPAHQAELALRGHAFLPTR